MRDYCRFKHIKLFIQIRSCVLLINRMGRKPITRSNNSLDNLLIPAEEPEP
jgi:hypothetical protein